MTKKWFDVPVLLWAALCGLTIVSMLLIESRWRIQVASCLLVLIAGIKSRWVVLHYMEARHAARHWRFLYETWVFASTAAIIIGYLVSLPSGPVATP